ncbi:MAG: hypothetical protein ABIK73_07875 [candidate division WOR-3 bacterium]
MGRKNYSIVVEPRNLFEALLSPLMIMSELGRARDYYVVFEDYEDEDFLEEVMEEIEEETKYLENSGFKEFLERELREQKSKPNI